MGSHTFFINRQTQAPSGFLLVEFSGLTASHKEMMDPWSQKIVLLVRQVCTCTSDLSTASRLQCCCVSYLVDGVYLDGVNPHRPW